MSLARMGSYIRLGSQHHCSCARWSMGRGIISKWQVGLRFKERAVVKMT